MYVNKKEYLEDKINEKDAYQEEYVSPVEDNQLKRRIEEIKGKLIESKKLQKPKTFPQKVKDQADEIISEHLKHRISFR